MELIESVMWLALGFGPTLAVLATISKAGIMKHGRKATEIGHPSSLKGGRAL